VSVSGQREYSDSGAYVSAIRNAKKRAYATQYRLWLLAGRNGDSPEVPTGLSYMGAQAVRLQLADFIPESVES
jgi:hypothetical protein